MSKIRKIFGKENQLVSKDGSLIKKWKRTIMHKNDHFQESGLIVAVSMEEYIRTKKEQPMSADAHVACAQFVRELAKKELINASLEGARSKY